MRSSDVAWLLVVVAMSGCAAPEDARPSTTPEVSAPWAPVAAHGGCEWSWWEAALYADLPEVAADAGWTWRSEGVEGVPWTIAGAREGWPDPWVAHVALDTSETTFFLRPGAGSLSSYSAAEGDHGRVAATARELLATYFGAPDDEAGRLAAEFMASGTSGGPNGSTSREVQVGRPLALDRIWSDLSLDAASPTGTADTASFEATDERGQWEVAVRFPRVAVALPGEPALELVARGSGWIGAVLAPSRAMTRPNETEVRQTIVDAFVAARASAPSFERWQSSVGC